MSRKVKLKKNFWYLGGFKPKNLLWRRCGYFPARYNHYQCKLVWKGTFYLLQFLQFSNIYQLTEGQGEQYQGSTQKGCTIQIFTPSVPKILFGKLSVLFFGGVFPHSSVLKCSGNSLHLKLCFWTHSIHTLYTSLFSNYILQKKGMPATSKG